MTKLVIIRGLPGSGKSTLAKEFAKKFGCIHYETDTFFMEDNVYKYDASKIKEAHAWCQQCVRQALSHNSNVVVSNTFVKKWEIQPYIDMCNELKIEYEIIVATGEYTNTHGVPQEVIDRMKANWEN